MNRSSIFGIKIDFEKSRGSYVFDKKTRKNYLDFMGMYATLALGYNHPALLSESFRAELLRVAHVKITNCEMKADESEEFNEAFIDYTCRGIFTHFHYCCTGALAIEAAIKTCIDYKGIVGNPRVISFKGNFHGINSYGGIVTDRFAPVSGRLNGFPGPLWQPLDNPIITYENKTPSKEITRVQEVLAETERTIREDGNVVCILVEPIQCTYGDAYFPNEFFQGLRHLARNYDVPLVFDEIQVGFGTTGKIWYFEHLDVIPDILVFGKKTQLSGIMVQDKFSKIFQTPIRLEVTWDADIIDMIRCKHIIKAYKEYRILDNVIEMSKKMYEGLLAIDNLINIRRCGLLFAFDFVSKSKRDRFGSRLLAAGMLANFTRDHTVRLRPNLNVSETEIDHALGIIRGAAKEL